MALLEKNISYNINCNDKYLFKVIINPIIIVFQKRIPKFSLLQ